MAFLELRKRVLQLAEGPDVPADRAVRALRTLGFQALRMVRDAITGGRLKLSVDINPNLVDYWPENPSEQTATERAGDTTWALVMEKLAADHPELPRRFGAFIVSEPGTITDSSGAVLGYKSIREYSRDDWRHRAWDYAAALELLAELAGKGKRDGEAATPALDNETEIVLRDLRDNAPRLRKGVDIETSTKVSRKTAGKCIAWLVENGYAVFPQGERKGATVTTTGKALADRLCPQSTH